MAKPKNDDEGIGAAAWLLASLMFGSDDSEDPAPPSSDDGNIVIGQLNMGGTDYPYFGYSSGTSSGMPFAFGNATGDITFEGHLLTALYWASSQNRIILAGDARILKGGTISYNGSDVGTVPTSEDIGDDDAIVYDSDNDETLIQFDPAIITLGTGDKGQSVTFIIEDPDRVSDGDFVLHAGASSAVSAWGYSDAPGDVYGTLTGDILPGHTLNALTFASTAIVSKYDGATITGGTAADLTALMATLELVLASDSVLDLRNFLVPNGFQISSSAGYANFLNADYEATGNFTPYLRTATHTGDSRVAYGDSSGAPAYIPHQCGIIDGAELIPGNPLVSSTVPLTSQFDVAFYAGPGAMLDATALDTFLTGKSLVLKNAAGTTLMTKTFASATKANTGSNNEKRRYRWSTGGPTLTKSSTPFDSASATYYTLSII